MKTTLLQFWGFLCLFLLVALGASACTGSESADPASSRAEETVDAAVAGPDESVEAAGATPAPAPAPTPEPPPSLEDEDLTDIVELSAGDQIQDSQGNLVAVYGFMPWPAPFGDLPTSTRAAFAFPADVAGLAQAETTVIVLDVGMCSAGIDAAGVATAEFFVHTSADEPLADDPVFGRGTFPAHPVVSPGFDFPNAATCSRGWLPVLLHDDERPGTARYLLTTRASQPASVERYLYQWQIGPIEPERAPDGAADVFGIGQTVTFNDGRLAETTVVVDGWTELVDAAAPLDGTRLVAVSLTVCPAGDRIPEFAITLDRWTLVTPIEPSALRDADEAEACSSGWLEFAVPFGAVPTGFVASDGVDPLVGLAEWSLADAALAAPE